MNLTEWTVFEKPAHRCRACGAWDKGSKCYKLSGDGNPEAQIALVGEGPGWKEEELEKPFVGRAGELLDGCITDAGLLRSELWITNSARCRLINKIGKDRKPSMHELDCCRGHTLDELREIKPKVIVALGDVASAMLLSRRFGGIREERGKVTWSDEWQAWIIQTLHPAFALRQYAQRHFIIEDLKTAKRLVEEHGPRIVVPTDIEIVSSIAGLQRVKEEILDAGHFHFDWETNGLHLTKSEGFCVSFSIREGHAFVVPRLQESWQDYWGRHLREADAMLREIMLSDCTKGGFHVGFDMSITQTTLGVRPTNVTFCGMIAHHALNNHLGQGAHGLKSCVALYTPMGRYDDELDAWLKDHNYTVDGKADYAQLWRAPNEIVWKYNGMDSDGSLRLEHIFVPQLHEECLWKIFTADLMPVAIEHQETDRIGVRINVPYVDEVSAQLAAGLATLEEKIAELAGHSVNPSSPKQVANLLFEEQGLPILGRTDNGDPSTKEELLLQVKDLSDFVPLILQHRAFAKIKGTYVDGKNSVKGQKKALRAVIDDDGYARMNTLVHGTETFRFVTRKPFALHTWPKTVPGMPSVRAFVIPDDGYTFITRDFKQQEFVIQCILAGQWDMVEALLDRDEDVHELVTQELGGVAKKDYLLAHSYDSEGYAFDGLTWINKDAYQLYKAARSKFKSVNFMIMFRGMAKKLARMALGCTGDQRRGVICKVEGTVVCGCEARAQEYITNYYERYEHIKWWQYRTIKIGYETGRSVTPFGTYRKLPAFFDSDAFTRFEAERQACNAPIQISGAHVMRRAYLKIKERLRKEKFPGRVVFTVHDEITCQFRSDLIEEGDYIMRRYMEAPYPELAGRSLRTDGVTTSCWGG